MLRNYYLTAIRNLFKQKGYFLLNISGLAVGIASFIFISLYIHNELSYDKFHSQADNIYRVHVKGQMTDQKLDMCVTASPMSKALVNDYPEVIKATRIRKSGAWFIGYGDKKFNEDGVLFADSSFFNVFSFDLISGDPNTALVNPRSMVLTERQAQKYFGDENPMGKQITVEEDSILYTITGVLADIPENSHLKFDMMGSINSHNYWNNSQWVSHNFYTYIVLEDHVEAAIFEPKMRDLIVKYVGPQIKQFLHVSLEDWEDTGNFFEYELMSLTDIHLNSNLQGELRVNGNISYIYIYSLIAFILLSIAIINFINLATAQSASRAKEVGIRKVTGSTKTGLIYQFIFESIIVSVLATMVAFLLVVGLTPQFVELVGKNITLDILTTPWVWAALLGLSLIIGILAGSYPAFVLASFRPVKVLNGTISSGVKSSKLRNLLVVAQFTASIIIIISTAVVYYQTQYMLSKNLGFDKEQILVIRRPDALQKNIDVFKNEALTDPNVSTITNSMSIPGKPNYNSNTYIPENDPENPVILFENRVSFGYSELMRLKLVEGRFLSREYASDSSAIILNQSAVKKLGFEHAIGKRFITRNYNKKNEETINYLTIIGVVEDYHTESLHETIKPTLLRLMPGNWEGYLQVKIKNNHDINKTISVIEDTWYKYSYNKPFQYFFFDEDYEKLYQSENTTGKIFLVFAFLSIFIACLGLVGLITFSITIRQKEIGIRKVLGANSLSIANLLSREVFKLICVATLISWPLAYYASNYWLENFAERIGLQPWIYISSTLIVGLIGIGAISIQTIRATTTNPIESLRSE